MRELRTGASMSVRASLATIFQSDARNSKFSGSDQNLEE